MVDVPKLDKVVHCDRSMLIVASSTQKWIDSVNSRVSWIFRKLAFTYLINLFEIKYVFS